MKKILSWLNPRNLRIGTIVIPWLIGAIYLYFFAADRFVSEAVLAVRNNSETPTIVSGLSSLFPTAGNSVRTDSLTLSAYIRSGDMLDAVSKQLDLGKIYSEPRLDFVYRLATGANRERLLAYFRDSNEVTFDDDSGLLTIRSQAFNAADSAKINLLLVQLCESFINETSHRIAREQMVFAEEQQKRSQGELEKAKLGLQGFQNRFGVLDPLAQAQASSGLTVDLQATITRQETDLKGLLGFMSDTAPQVAALRKQIEGARQQLEQERRRGTADGARLNVMASEYQALTLKVDFAQDAYKAATAALETARLESTRKLKTLVMVETPSVPAEPTMPRRAYSLLALLLGLSLVYGIVRLVVTTIEDHQA